MFSFSFADEVKLDKVDPDVSNEGVFLFVFSCSDEGFVKEEDPNVSIKDLFLLVFVGSVGVKMEEVASNVEDAGVI